MNIILFLPPLISIFLLCTSFFPKNYLVRTVKTYVSTKDHLKKHEKVIRFVALSWAAKLGYFNSMIMALFSSFSIWSSTGDYTYCIGTIVILIMIFIPMTWWIMSHEPDELASTVTKRYHLTHDAICSIILLLVNILLIVAIYLSQKLTP